MNETDRNKKEDQPKKDIDKDFWNERWKTNDTRWDMKQVSPPLKHYIDTLVNKEIAILIPGCGNAYEAEYLLQSGFKNITLIDIAPALVSALLSKYEQFAGKELTLICGDFFKHEGTYDLILEQTFFCALSPDLRKDYVQKMHSLLAKDRKLAGLLFDKEFEDSPPFGGNAAEYQQLFSDNFEIETLEACTTSIERRMGTELFFEFRKKDQA